jgi:hypothetical protein
MKDPDSRHSPRDKCPLERDTCCVLESYHQKGLLSQIHGRPIGAQIWNSSGPCFSGCVVASGTSDDLWGPMQQDSSIEPNRLYMLHKWEVSSNLIPYFLYAQEDVHSASHSRQWFPLQPFRSTKNSWCSTNSSYWQEELQDSERHRRGCVATRVVSFF